MRCVDLFAGCGGLSLGFENAGFAIAAAYDDWQPAIDVYQANFEHPIFKLDLRDEAHAIEHIAPYKPALIMGGPPCQDFSSAGKRDPSLGRADLTYHFANIICVIKPKWFVMENVEQIKKSYILEDIVQQFSEHHYGLSSVILDASYCGVPQSRTRFFLIGHLGDSHNQLTPLINQQLSPKPMTIRDYLGDSLGIQYYYRHPRNYNRRGIFSIDEPSPTVRGVNRPIPPSYKPNQCDPVGICLDDIRPLTTQERGYLQTFPKDFNFFGTKTNLEQMIGNAVPVNLATFVANSISAYQKNSKPKQQLALFESEEQFKLPDRALHHLSL